MRNHGRIAERMRNAEEKLPAARREVSEPFNRESQISVSNGNTSSAPVLWSRKGFGDG
jgi:hypothetical protein